MLKSWLVSICAQGGSKNPSEAAVMWEDASGRIVRGCGAQGKPKEGLCLVRHVNCLSSHHV
jgi:hypothetical protein